MKELKVISFFLKAAWRASKKYIVTMSAGVLLRAVVPFIAVWMPKLILDELTGRQDWQHLLLLVALTITATLILNWVAAALDRVIQTEAVVVQNGLMMQTSRVMMTIPYSYLEDSDFINLRERAIYSANFRILSTTIEAIPALISAFISIAGAVAILLSFDYLLVLAIIAIVLINFLLQRYFQKKQIAEEQKGVDIHKFFTYYRRFFADRNLNMDSRVNGMEDFLMRKSEKSDHHLYTMVRGEFKFLHLNEGVSSALSAVQVGLVFAYVGFRTVTRKLGVGNFSLYSNAAIVFDTYLRKFFDALLRIRRNTVLLEDFMKLHSMAPQPKTGSAPLPAVGESGFEITFQDVWFRYPGTASDVLKGINLTIKKGERISIVGRNGAGKTTFIKLLARLYVPDKGRILLDGVDIQTIDPDDYIEMLSVVFQDFRLFEFPVFDNIALTDESATDEAVIDALKKGGIYDYIKTLPEGIHTPAGRFYDENGTEFSGGQKQKLAISRAIYKNAAFIVLDEPTAALDPLAEAETYEKFNDVIIGTKTAIYISHRLSSSKFCDRVVFLEDAVIKEQGTHRELMAQNGGYAQMFLLQQRQLLESDPEI